MLFKNLISQNANKILALFIPFCFNSIAMADNFDSIFDIARRAPSSHNAQMWKCERISINECEVSIDNEKVLRKVDPNNREAWISIGAFVENCIRVASDLGFILNYKYEDSKVILSISGTKIKEKHYIPTILQRCTDRKPYKKNPLPTDIVIEEHCKYVDRESELGEKIGHNIFYANKQQLENKEKSKELAEWTITSYKEGKKRNDGLSPSALGLSKFQKFFFLSFFNKRNIGSRFFVQQTLNGLKSQINNCAGFIIITSEKSTPEEWFYTGIRLEKIWLNLTEQGISVHPMSQSIEEKKSYSDLKSFFNEKEEIQMLLRVGYPHKKTLPVSKREDII